MVPLSTSLFQLLFSYYCAVSVVNVVMRSARVVDEPPHICTEKSSLAVNVLFAETYVVFPAVEHAPVDVQFVPSPKRRNAEPVVVAVHSKPKSVVGVKPLCMFIVLVPLQKV